VPLGGRASIIGFAAVFNLFNHANYGDYELTEKADCEPESFVCGTYRTVGLQTAILSRRIEPLCGSLRGSLTRRRNRVAVRCA
jgi:hypothetical protein